MTADGLQEPTQGARDRLLRALLWLGLAAQAAAAVWAERPWIAGDSAVYLRLADSLAQGCFGKLVGSSCEADALRPPGYPLILAAQMHGLGLSLAAVVVLQVGLYLFSLFLMERVLQRLGMSPVPLLVATLIYPFVAIYGASIMAEAWATLALSAIAFILCAHPPRALLGVAVGLISGAAALIRSDLLLVPVLLAGVIYTQLRPALPFRKAAGQAVLPVAAAAMVLLPYVAWNASAFGKPSPAPVASAVGNTLYLAVWQSRLSHDDLEPLYQGKVTPAVAASGLVPEMKHLNVSIGAAPLTVPFNPAAYRDQETQVRSSQVFGTAALQHIKGAPGAYAAHVATNLWLLWNTSIYPSGLPAPARLVLRLVSAIVFVAGILGLLVAMAGNHRRQLLPAAALLLYLPAVHIWLHTEARYTAAARPLLLLFVAVFVSLAAHRVRNGLSQLLLRLQ